LLNPNETIGRVTNVLVENFTAVSENGFFVSGLGGNDSSTVSGIENISFVNVHVLVQQLPSNNATNGPHAAHDDTTGGRIAAPIDAFFVEYASGVAFWLLGGVQW
jgi:hypothetical protein